jgi:CelD/BcsL family acetyltransferase involved in cellulose biosynthesis
MVNKPNINKIEWLLVEDITCLKEHLAQWQQLILDTKSNLFCSPKWIMTWIQTYWQPDWQLKTIMGFENKKLIAIAPLYTQHHNKLLLNSQLLPLGQGEPEECEVSSEFQDVIIQSGYNKNYIYAEIANEIRAIKYDQIKCYSLLPNSNLSKILLKINSFQLNTIGKRYLLTNNENYVQNLSKNNKKKWKRCKNKLESFNAEYVWVNEEQYNEVWSKLILFHQQRWNAKGKLGAFFHQDFTNFQEKIQNKNITKMSAILINGIPIVINYYLHDHDTLYFYQCGWNENEYANLSPGFSLHIWSIINNPLKCYDFMMSNGTNSYKKIFNTTKIESMYDITIYRNSFINFVYRKLNFSSKARLFL